MLINVISKLVSPNDSASINRLVAGDSFSSLLSKFERTVIYLLHSKKLYDDELKTQIGALCKELGEINTFRNCIMHSLWAVLDDNEILTAKYSKYIIKNKRQEILDNKAISRKEFDNFPDRIDAAISSLVLLKNKIEKLLHE
jgi:hypothetical protein